MTIRRFTHKQGNMILQKVNESLPEKINDDLKFPWEVRGTYDRNARQLFKAIKKVSPGFQARPTMKPVFGDPSNWKDMKAPTVKVPDGLGGFREVEIRGRDTGAAWEIIDNEKEVELDLNAKADDALSIMLVVFAHPDSKSHLSPADQDEIVWPLAEQLCIVPWLEEKIGITKGQEIKVQYTPKPEPGAPAAPPA